MAQGVTIRPMKFKTKAKPLPMPRLGSGNTPKPLKAAEPINHMGRAVSFLKDFDTAEDGAMGNELSPFRVPGKIKDVS